MTEESYGFEANLEDGEIEELELEEDKLQINEDKPQMDKKRKQSQTSPAASTTSSRKTIEDDFDIEPKASGDDTDDSYEKIEDFQKRRRIRNERKKKKLV